MARSKKARDTKDIDQIVPKKKWNTLGDVRDYLVGAKVKIVNYNGYQILTDKYAYSILDSVLYIVPKDEAPKPVDLTKRYERRPKPVVVEKLNIPKESKSDILAQMKKRGEKLLAKKTKTKKKAAKKGKKK